MDGGPSCSVSASIFNSGFALLNQAVIAVCFRGDDLGFKNGDPCLTGGVVSCPVSFLTDVSFLGVEPLLSQELISLLLAVSFTGLLSKNKDSISVSFRCGKTPTKENLGKPRRAPENRVIVVVLLDLQCHGCGFESHQAYRQGV